MTWGLVAWGEFVVSVRVQIGWGYREGVCRDYMDELTAHRRGRGGGLWGDFIEKHSRKQC